MNYKGVIFDLDGTLLDSLPGIADAANGLLAEMNFPKHPLESYRNFVGEGIVELIKRVLPSNWQTMATGQQAEEKGWQLEEMVVRYRFFYGKTWPQGTSLYPGIRELLGEMCEKKIKMAVLSNKSDDFTRLMVQTLLGDFGFTVVRGAREGVPAKPAPDAALEIAAVMDCEPKETVFVGDSGIDMQTAVRARMVPVGVLWGFREAPELLENGAKKLIRRPAELMPMLV